MATKTVVKKGPAKVAKTAPPAKKAPVKAAKRVAPPKVAVKKTATKSASGGRTAVKKAAPAKSTPAKAVKAVKSVAKKAAPTKKAASKVTPRETIALNAWGVRVGSDIDVVMQVMMGGAETRLDVLRIAEGKVNSMETRTGKKKNLLATVINTEKRLRESGWTFEKTYKAIPPAA